MKKFDMILDAVFDFGDVIGLWAVFKSWQDSPQAIGGTVALQDGLIFVFNNCGLLIKMRGTAIVTELSNGDKGVLQFGKNMRFGCGCWEESGCDGELRCVRRLNGGVVG